MSLPSLLTQLAHHLQVCAIMLHSSKVYISQAVVCSNLVDLSITIEPVMGLWKDIVVSIGPYGQHLASTLRTEQGQAYKHRLKLHLSY